MENSTDITQEVKSRIPYDPAIPLLVRYLQEMESLSKYLYFHVHCSIIHSGQGMEKPKCLLMDEWIKKITLKKEGNLAVCDNMGP